MKTWVISDTHFYHENTIKWCGRPEDFNELIVQNWIRNIHPNDLVYHLGDVFFYKKQECQALLRGLPGQKILIKGNHDKVPVAWYLHSGFLAVMEYALVYVKHTKGKERPINRYYKVLLSHKPMNVPEEVDVNVHGHFHNAGSSRWEEILLSQLSSKHRLFSLEDNDYRPMDLGNALFYDQLIHTQERARKMK